jgi:Spy/CpxP family protein refolding chaperone
MSVPQDGTKLFEDAVVQQTLLKGKSMKRALALLFAAAAMAWIVAPALAADATPPAATSRPHARHAGLLARVLELTDAQKAQVKDILKAAHADAQKATDAAAKKAVWKAAFAKIRTDVLTDAQRAKLVKMHRMHGVIQKLNLTADQKAKVKDILTAARADAAKATTPEAKREIFKAAMAKVKADVLTDAQRQQLEQMKEKRHEKAPPPAKTTT